MYRQFISPRSGSPRRERALLIIMLMAALVVVLAGCTGHHDGEVTTVQPKEKRLSYFYNKLENAYKTAFEPYGFPPVSGNLAGVGYFSQKHRAIQRKQLVLPETIENYNLPYENLDGFYDARLRLLAAMNRNARLKAPEDAAAAQAYFDCWIAEAASVNLTGEDAISPESCRTHFYTHLAAVEAVTRPQGFLAPGVEIVSNSPQRYREYTVYFDFDEATLTDEARETVEAVARIAMRTPAPIRMFLVGHTDTVGSEQYNQKLSERRAHAVMQALRTLGVDEQRIRAEGRGEQELQVATADGVRHERNRRVEATLTIRAY